MNHNNPKGYLSMWKATPIFLFVVNLITLVSAESVPEFKWRAVEIDAIEIGYGLQMADVNGDGKTDIVLADKSTIQWYENPTWAKHVIARDLTKRDNVCITARDIDGDGKCEIAVGGQWNFRETIKDGAVFYLIAPEDPAEPWTPVELHHEPSVHRMHWIKGTANQFHLVVKPLRGRGSVDGEGAGIRVLEYSKPRDPKAEWKYDVVCDFMHLSHNFHPVNWDDDEEEEMIIAGKEGVWHFDKQNDRWSARQLTDNFAGEIRDGKLPGGRRFIVAVEPMHGSKAAVYVEPTKEGDLWQLVKVLDEALKDGHALACADYLGVGSDQIVVGWRAMNDPGIPGIKLFTPLDDDATRWRQTPISAAELAVEDIKAADLDGDGRVDIVAAARQTKNLVIFFNETK
jgi:hypothetical protein